MKFNHNFDVLCCYFDLVAETNFTAHKVFWQEITSSSSHTYLVYDGVPFMLLGSLMYDCQFGRDKNLSRKRKYRLEKVRQNILSTLCIEKMSGQYLESLAIN